MGSTGQIRNIRYDNTEINHHVGPGSYKIPTNLFGSIDNNKESKLNKAP